jgi:hypothetical protein
VPTLTPTADLQAVTVTGRKINPEDVALIINGQEWRGWSVVRVTRGVERCSVFNQKLGQLLNHRARSLRHYLTQRTLARVRGLLLVK